MHVPTDTAVMVPLDEMVHTEGVVLRYDTPCPAGSVAGLVTAKVLPLSMSSVSEVYVQPVGVFSVWDDERS